MAFLIILIELTFNKYRLAFILRLTDILYLKHMFLNYNNYQSMIIL